MSPDGYKKRSRNVFDPSSRDTFKLSRSKLENFGRCHRCFYLDRRLGIAQPSGPPFTLNSAVDTLFKKEFDAYRERGEVHPLMKSYGINAIPFKHPSLDIWRENFKGVQFHHPKTNFLITGAIDDVWQRPDGELIIADYKATSTNDEIVLEGEWKEAYKRQMEIYQWLFRQNGFKVSRTGYFVYTNGLKDRDAFNDRLEFKTILLPYEGNDSWVEPAIIKAHDCLMSDVIPEYTPDCDFCGYQSHIRDIK